MERLVCTPGNCLLPCRRSVSSPGAEHQRLIPRRAYWLYGDTSMCRRRDTATHLVRRCRARTGDLTICSGQRTRAFRPSSATIPDSIKGRPTNRTHFWLPRGRIWKAGCHYANNLGRDGCRMDAGSRSSNCASRCDEKPIRIFSSFLANSEQICSRLWLIIESGAFRAGVQRSWPQCSRSASCPEHRTPASKRPTGWQFSSR